MSIISLIAIIDENYGLGAANKLLCHLPADLQRFKAITLTKPIIMGRKTYDSIGKILPGRTNIIISRQDLCVDGAIVCNSLYKAIDLVRSAPELMIIGGAGVFQQALPLAQRIYLSKIHAIFSADVFFPSLDPHIWRCCESIERPHDERNKYDITFCFYERYAFL